jgi:hypothetical protein
VAPRSSCHRGRGESSAGETGQWQNCCNHPGDTTVDSKTFPPTISTYCYARAIHSDTATHSAIVVSSTSTVYRAVPVQRCSVDAMTWGVASIGSFATGE